MPHAINNSHLLSLSWLKFNVLDEVSSPGSHLPSWAPHVAFRANVCQRERDLGLVLIAACSLCVCAVWAKAGQGPDQRGLGGLENIWSVDYRLL